MSLTDGYIIIYINIFATASSWVQDFIFQVPRYPFSTQRSMIYIMAIRLVMDTKLLSITFLLLSYTDYSVTLRLFLIIHNRGLVSSWVGRFKKFPKFKFLSSSPPYFFSQYEFKYGLMLITHHAGSVNIVINK
jgi:hypothetical protein